jgi:ACT domain-containing protein
MTKHNDDKEPGTDVDPHVKVTTLASIWFRIIVGLLSIILAGVSVICFEVLTMGKDLAAMKARDEIRAQEFSSIQQEVKDHESRIIRIESRSSMARTP